MAAPVPARHALLARPLYAYDLPPQLVKSVGVRSSEVDDGADEGSVPAEARDPDAGSREKAPDTHAIPPCTLCPDCRAFASLDAQRAHFRSDWHRYNLVLKQRGATRAPKDTSGYPQALHLVSAAQFDDLCTRLEAESSSDSDADDDAPSRGSDPLASLVQRLDLDGVQQRRDTGASQSTLHATLQAMRSPLVWYESRADAPPADKLPQTQLGVYRDVLPSGVSYEDALAAMQLPQITVRPRKNGWTAKRLQGAKTMGRSMQMAVLDGTGLLPWLDRDVNEDSESSASSDDESDDSSDVSSASDSGVSPERAPVLPPLRFWTIVMLGGGHFAAAVIALNPHIAPQSEHARAQGKAASRGIVVVAHKTFHRYTTRRKQGGSQALQDASGKHAKSAGANLRRYGEARLADEIRELFARPGWRELIRQSERVWVRASARSARGVLWRWTGTAQSPLDGPLQDGSLAHLPIATQRPTLSEIMRCFFELTRVKVAHLSAEQLAAQTDAQRDAIARALRADAASRAPAVAAPAPKAQRERRDQRETLRRERFERLVSMVHKGKLDALVQLLARHETDLLRPGGWDADAEAGVDADRQRIDAPLPAWWRASEGRSAAALVPATLLQLAAQAGHADIVQYLLVERRADPTLPVPRPPAAEDAPAPPHRTAFDLCSSKQARAVFRRMMAEQPEWCDWGEMGEGGARVPSALTTEMEEAQATKARTRRTALRERAREREAKAGTPRSSTPEAADPQPPTETRAAATRASQRLGGGGPLGADEGLSDAMRMRIERERRARAAEARMAALKK